MEPEFLMCMFIVFLIIAVAMFAFKISLAKKNMKEPEITVIGNVVEKQSRTTLGEPIVIDTEDGKRLKLYDASSSNLVVGDCGEFKYRGMLITGFTKK